MCSQVRPFINSIVTFDSLELLNLSWTQGNRNPPSHPHRIYFMIDVTHLLLNFRLTTNISEFKPNSNILLCYNGDQMTQVFFFPSPSWIWHKAIYTNYTRDRHFMLGGRLYCLKLETGNKCDTHVASIVSHRRGNKASSCCASGTLSYRCFRRRFWTPFLCAIKI